MVSSPDEMQIARSQRNGRLCVLAAAILWSTSGAFTKLLTQPTSLGLDEPLIAALDLGGFDFPVQLAFYRVLFAGLFLVPILRPRHVSFRGLMVFSALIFGVMNFLYLSAQALGTAANAVLLQYSAPMWLYLASICLLGEKSDSRSTVSLVIGMTGIAVIVGGNLQGAKLTVVMIGLASGVTYAIVLICLRVMREVSSTWITIWNQLCGALLLLPFVWSLEPPTLPQFVLLFFFGSLQLGLPYYLMARGLKTVSPQEAGVITLLEPILNPVWAYIVSPATEKPQMVTLVGGVFIVGALAWRYWPSGKRKLRTS